MNEPENILRRAAVRRIALLGAASAGGLSGWISEALAQKDSPIAQGVQDIKGRVTINGIPAKLGMAILPGDRIVTPTNAQLSYVFGDSAFLQRGDSEVRFGDSAARFLRVVTGRLLSVFGGGAKTLATATATIGIRGTGCYIEAEPDRSYFCLCYGEADVLPIANPKKAETIRSKHHDHPIYIGGSNDDKVMGAAKIINHSDIELTLLEAMVGRTPPFADTTSPAAAPNGKAY